MSTPETKPTRILLIRHGINDYVREQRLAGWTPGVHLNDEGRMQAQALAERLRDAPLAAVYSSPLERCMETAQALAELHGLPVQVLAELGETRCGEWTGQRIPDLQKLDLWRLVQTYPSGTRFPGGETGAEVQARLVAALERLQVAHAGQTIAVASHSDPIKMALAHYIGLHLDLSGRLVIRPTSISELVFTPFGPRLARCNDCAHLPEETS